MSDLTSVKEDIEKRAETLGYVLHKVHIRSFNRLGTPYF